MPSFLIASSCATKICCISSMSSAVIGSDTLAPRSHCEKYIERLPPQLSWSYPITIYFVLRNWPVLNQPFDSKVPQN